ncbi:MAG: hypothetical protein Q9163_004936 [Psora crenata]
MTLSIMDLPYELLSTILYKAAQFNSRDNKHYTYGLSQAPEPALEVSAQRVVRGNVPADAQKWNAVAAIRLVNRQWHSWALEYALRDLYIRRWKGSERWMQSRDLSNLHGDPSSIAVYRNPFESLHGTLKLFTAHPAVGIWVRRVWFDGFYSAEANAKIFAMLRLCDNLAYVTLPWTALRYGTVNDWSNLLGGNSQGRSIESLELLAVNLKRSQIDKQANGTDNRPLDSPQVNFKSLQRLKIQGHSNFLPITDADLVAIARTAAQLRAIHVTGRGSLTNHGIGALAEASRETVEIIEHFPLAAAASLELFVSSPDRVPEEHLCSRLLACPRLRNLSLSIFSICPELFANTAVRWVGEVRIRTRTICGHAADELKASPAARDSLWQTLDNARALMESRGTENAELDIEVFIGDWIFELGRRRVHGNFTLARTLADGTWPAQEETSGKGPYGQNGLFGKDEGDWTAVGEDVFRDGLRKGYIKGGGRGKNGFERAWARVMLRIGPLDKLPATVEAEGSRLKRLKMNGL